MTLYLNNRHPRARISRRYFEKRVKRILRRLEKPRVILGITFVTDREIRRLNRLYRGKDRATDVLSFGGAREQLLGDIVISLDTASRQAKERGWPVRSEILFLIIHGILHLLGYDHVRHKDWVRMKKKEEFLWKAAAAPED